MLLPALLSVVFVFSLILPAWVAGASATVSRPDGHYISHLAADSSSAAPAMALNTPEGEVIPMVATGDGYTVGLKSDGTVVAVGQNDDGQCDVDGWTDITQVAAGLSHTVGLKSDGTVVAVGSNYEGQCDVDGWTDITRVAAGLGHTVGLKSDGTVVATAYNASGWTDIAQVAAGGWHTVGLKSDGTVVAVGANDYGQCNVSSWTDIVQVAASTWHTVGLESASTVVAVGANDYGQCDVGGWNLVLAMPPSQEGQVGIKTGDWIKFEYKINGWPAGQPYPEWLKLEFLSVEGTSANVRVTMHISDGTEQSDTVPVDVVTGGSEAFGLPGAVISSNLTTGDSVYMTGFGDVAIEGETTRTYTGANRTVVYASSSQDEVQLTYYWDKSTGVMVEASTTYGGMTAIAKATETNMWEATTVGMPWWPWIIVAVAAVALALVVYRLKKRTTPTAPTPPTEGT